MSLKRLVGIGTNEKFLDKERRKELELEQDLDSKALKGWRNSKNPIEVKIKNLINIWKDTDPDFPRRFFVRHPELVPTELNPFIKLNDNELQLKKELLEKEKEILELKIKLKKYEQSQ